MGTHRSSRSTAFGFMLLASLFATATAQDTATVLGRAIDVNGKPMAGCGVGLFDLGHRFDTKALLANPTTRTDADGNYRLTAPRNHYQVVVVVAKGFQVCVQRLQGEASELRHMPDALMLPGTSLRGRVRDADGKPIAGATVRVEDSLNASAFVMTWFESTATSDEKGIFEAPGVPRTGLRVTASAPGFPAISRLVAHDSPLDITLVHTGLVRGTVVDSDGSPIANASVRAYAIEPGDDAGVVTDANGRYVVTVPNSRRFRLRAYEDKPPHRQFGSALLHGPADDVGLTADALKVPGDAVVVTVRCIDAVTKAPIEDFHASWSGIDFKNGIFAIMRHPETRKPFRGEARIDVVRSAGGNSLGTIVVDARGHGFVTLAVPVDLREALVAELGPECCISGRVLDATTGKPAVGAAVRAIPSSEVYGGNPDPFTFGFRTDGEGRYRIVGLPPGDYDVQAYGKGRPASRSKRVSTSIEKEGNLDLTVPEARFLEFEVLGDIPADCLGLITWDSSLRWSGSGGGAMLDICFPPPPSVPLSGSRTHKLGPIANGDYHAWLMLPTRDRVGGGLRIDLGDVVKPGTQIQLPDLTRCLFQGRVQLPTDVPAERVAVVARRIETDRRDPFRFLKEQCPFAVCLGSDGSFVIDLAPGTYAFQAVDLETGLVFHTTENRTVVPGERASPIVIVPTIHWLEITFASTVANTPSVCTNIKLDVERPRRGELPAALRVGSGSNDWQEIWWSNRAGVTTTRWLVHPGNIKLEALQAFHHLRARLTREPAAPVDTASIDVTNPVHRVTFRLPPPPTDAELDGTAK